MVKNPISFLNFWEVLLHFKALWGCRGCICTPTFSTPPRKSRQGLGHIPRNSLHFSPDWRPCACRYMYMTDDTRQILFFTYTSMYIVLYHINWNSNVICYDNVSISCSTIKLLRKWQMKFIIHWATLRMRIIIRLI